MPSTEKRFDHNNRPQATTETRNEVQIIDHADQLAATVNDLIDRHQHEPTIDFEVPADFVLSIVIPAYDEIATIEQVIRRVQSLPISKQIVVVDDYSTDGTRQLLKSLSHREDIKVVFQLKNMGKGAALRTGFEYATGDIVVVQDADLEYDPHDILPLLQPILENRADVVYGSRFLGDKPQDPSWVHRFGNGLLTGASNLTTGLKLTDMETCYKAFHRDALKDVTIKQNRFGFEPEITAKLARRGYRISEVPIGYEARSYDEGKKIGVKDLFNAMYCIARYGVGD